MRILLFNCVYVWNNFKMCNDSDCLLKLLIGIVCSFVVFIILLLRLSKKKQQKILNLQIQKVWEDYASLSQTQGLSMQDLLLGLRKDQSLSQFCLLVKTMLGQETQINLRVFNREYVFSLQNKKYKVSRKVSFRSKLVLLDEQENEIMKYESIGLFGMRHHFFNNQYDFKSKLFWAKMSSGYQYSQSGQQVGFCHPLYGNKNYGQILVLDAKIPLEFRVFMLVVNWMGL